jgi:hypothetical protein
MLISLFIPFFFVFYVCFLMIFILFISVCGQINKLGQLDVHIFIVDEDLVTFTYYIMRRVTRVVSCP